MEDGGRQGERGTGERGNGDARWPSRCLSPRARRPNFSRTSRRPAFCYRTMRIIFPALLLLAACAGPDAGEKRTSAADTTPAAANLQQQAGAPAADSADPPDFGDPRRFLSLDSIRWAE